MVLWQTSSSSPTGAGGAGALEGAANAMPSSLALICVIAAMTPLAMVLKVSAFGTSDTILDVDLGDEKKFEVVERLGSIVLFAPGHQLQWKHAGVRDDLESCDGKVVIRLGLADEGEENRGVLDLPDDACEVALGWIPREIHFVLVGRDVLRARFPVGIEDVVEPCEENLG
eukprot:scaffold247_cov39-Cyclotella_meneghiniana.AAC.2